MLNFPLVAGALIGSELLQMLFSYNWALPPHFPILPNPTPKKVGYFG